jgi:hypothetical protein
MIHSVRCCMETGVDSLLMYMLLPLIKGNCNIDIARATWPHVDGAGCANAFIRVLECSNRHYSVFQ